MKGKGEEVRVFVEDSYTEKSMKDDSQNKGRDDGKGNGEGYDYIHYLAESRCLFPGNDNEIPNITEGFLHG